MQAGIEQGGEASTPSLFKLPYGPWDWGSERSSAKYCSESHLWDLPGSPVVRICLPMQGTQFDPWSGMIPHAVGELSLRATTTEACVL